MIIFILTQIGGEGGIRTLGSPKGSLDFESSPFGHSGTSPFLLRCNDECQLFALLNGFLQFANEQHDPRHFSYEDCNSIIYASNANDIVV